MPMMVREPNSLMYAAMLNCQTNLACIGNLILSFSESYCVMI